MKILWKYRKMGDSWEQDAKPNPDAVVYNMGGPLFVFGWFLYLTGKINEDAIVYSYGELYFMQGWILFSLAMSITA